MEPYTPAHNTATTATPLVAVKGGAIKKVARLTRKLKAKMKKLAGKARKVGGEAEKVAEKAEKIKTEADAVAEEVPVTETEVKEEMGVETPAAADGGRRRRKTRKVSRKSKHRRSLFGLKY